MATGFQPLSSSSATRTKRIGVDVIRAGIGFRAKTGRAIGVVLCDDGETPRFVWRGEVSLVDPAMPATAQPYHEVMELPWDDATIAVQKFAVAIQAIAKSKLQGIVTEMRSRRIQVRAVGVVGSSPRRLEAIGNYHIRAHAAEGILFRRVLEEAAAANALFCCAFSDREINAGTLAAIRGGESHVKETLNTMRRVAGTPWRADERLAATAAWLALTH